jgi:hypothetical protein
MEERGTVQEGRELATPPEFLVRASRDEWSRSVRRKRNRKYDAGSVAEPLSTDRDKLETTGFFFSSAALVCIVRLAGRELEHEAQGRGGPVCNWNFSGCAGGTGLCLRVLLVMWGGG